MSLTRIILKGGGIDFVLDESLEEYERRVNEILGDLARNLKPGQINLDMLFIPAKTDAGRDVRFSISEIAAYYSLTETERKQELVRSDPLLDGVDQS